MFLRFDKPKAQGAEIQRAVNTHLSKVAKAKRRAAKEKLDRQQAQRLRRQREAENHVAEAGFDIATQHVQHQDLASSLLLNRDAWMAMDVGRPDHKQSLQACHEFLTLFVPYEARVLGLTSQQEIEVGSTLALWTMQYDMVCFALAVFRLCCLPETQDLLHPLRLYVESMREQMIARINQRLIAHQVDDVLIFGIVLAIVIDIYFDHSAFVKVHLEGLRTIIQLRGGFGAIGNSDSGITLALRTVVLTVFNIAQFHINTTSDDQPQHADGVSTSTLIQESFAKDQRKISSGFVDLAEWHLISTHMLEVIAAYSSWLSGLEPGAKIRIRPWSQLVPQGLNSLERCILVALACVAADLVEAESQNLSTLLLRKPAARARALLSLQCLWEDVRLINCTLWLAVIIAIPRQVETTPRKEMRLIQERLFSLRPELRQSYVVEQVLDRFVFPLERRRSILSTWAEIALTAS